ncbi:unknown [Alistipes sp. CAG:831]|nr:unknown [Alistipes sp. CAG:831]
MSRYAFTGISDNPSDIVAFNVRCIVRTCNSAAFVSYDRAVDNFGIAFAGKTSDLVVSYNTDISIDMAILYSTLKRTAEHGPDLSAAGNVDISQSKIFDYGLSGLGDPKQSHIVHVGSGNAKVAYRM